MPSTGPSPSRIVSITIDHGGTASAVWLLSGSRCRFVGLPSAVVDVLRALQQTRLSSQSRKAAGISTSDTVMRVARLYRCDAHGERCPRGDGPLPMSVIDASGRIDYAKLARLR